MSAQKSNKELRREHPNFSIEINSRSGFCFGVENAIKKAEQQLNSDEQLYCLGAIVHNKQEVSRLTRRGLKIITHADLKQLKNKKILFRAHGEPPESYAKIQQSGNDLIDATCPVVLKIQQRIKKAYDLSLETGGQIVIYGKPNHAEVNGLAGQTKNTALIIDSLEGISKIDFSKPIELFSQTTMSLEAFHELANLIAQKAQQSCKINDTICRQVSNRQDELKEFAAKYDLLFFVGDPQSSNSKVLFQVCKDTQPQSYFITDATDIAPGLLGNQKKIGICGATSTPLWLMQNVARFIEGEMLKNDA